MGLGREEFFEIHEAQGLALTFDDVRLATRMSDVTREQTDISSRFTEGVPLKAPIVSAAMRDVTDSKMATVLAKNGGIGVIPCTQDLEAQRKEVRAVKHAMNGFIDKPITVHPLQTMSSIESDRVSYASDFYTFPVVDVGGKLLGLITHNDFRFSRQSPASTAAENMKRTEELEVSTGETTIEDAYRIMREKRVTTLPVVDEAGLLQGMYLFSDVARIIEDRNSMYNVDSLGRLVVAAAVPTDPTEAVERWMQLRNYADAVVIDSAQGDSEFASIKTLVALREAFSDAQIMIGNITNPGSVERLVNEGANGIKVGQGGGSICTTRVVTGIGVPQLTAVYRCFSEARKFDIPICSDGGVTNHGDIPIAAAVGAASVMMGNMLAGTDEAPGRIIERPDGTIVKQYRGEGSADALAENRGSRQRYQQDGGVLAPEGVSGGVPTKGSADTLIQVMISYLRRSMSYQGARNLSELGVKAEFERVTGNGLRESGAHDIYY
ncbi:MAG TPA: IMP dehydrogenase [Candidatus Sulfotelmatobacter sp.]|nr:IMP dehydrogenase [Candidatus Sulfotelmatobacter sp.]